MFKWAEMSSVKMRRQHRCIKEESWNAPEEVGWEVSDDQMSDHWSFFSLFSGGKKVGPLFQEEKEVMKTVRKTWMNQKKSGVRWRGEDTEVKHIGVQVARMFASVRSERRMMTMPPLPDRRKDSFSLPSERDWQIEEEIDGMGSKKDWRAGATDWLTISAVAQLGEKRKRERRKR